MTTTYNDLYLDVRKMLRKAEVEAASLEARELICAASGKSREQFFQDLSLYAPASIQERLREFVERRLQGEPVAYLLGEWEFYGLPLTINPQVLIPRPDTELLAGRAISLLEQAGEGGRALDLCAGSGAIGLALASQVKTARVVLVELSPEAIQVCKQNIRRNHLTGRVTCFVGDAKLPPDHALGNFNLIACNPPYIPTEDIQRLDLSVRNFEPHLALDGGADGLDFYRTVACLWKACLRPGGTLLFEVGIHQAELVKDLMQAAGYQNIRIYPDSAGIPRVVEGSVPLE